MATLTHADWKRLLYPLALEDAQRRVAAGKLLPHHVWNDAQITASYAATDMVLAGRTLLLPMEQVRALVAPAYAEAAE